MEGTYPFIRVSQQVIPEQLPCWFSRCQAGNKEVQRYRRLDFLKNLPGEAKLSKWLDSSLKSGWADDTDFGRKGREKMGA